MRRLRRWIGDHGLVTVKRLQREKHESRRLGFVAGSSFADQKIEEATRVSRQIVERLSRLVVEEERLISNSIRMQVTIDPIVMMRTSSQEEREYVAEWVSRQVYRQLSRVHPVEVSR